MKKTIALAFLASLITASVTFASTDTTLDGKTFSGEIGMTGTKKKFKDDLVFKDGKFISTACEEQGFGPTAYTTKKTGENTTFEAMTKNAKGETMMWNGTIKGNHATATISKKTGTKTEALWYKGMSK